MLFNFHIVLLQSKNYSMALVMPKSKVQFSVKALSFKMYSMLQMQCNNTGFLPNACLNDIM